MTDLNKNKIIFKFLPMSFYKYILLIRLDKPIGYMLLFYPVSFGLAVSSKLDIFFLKQALLFFIGSIIMRSAGCVINDLWDRKIDKQIKRTKNRPLASGEISITNAFKALFILLFLGLIVLVQLNNESIILCLLILPLVVLYPISKKYFFCPQIVLGLVYNWGVIIGWSSSGMSESLDNVLLLYIACIIWTIIYDTVYATQDENEDRNIGLYSAAILFGNKKVLILSLLVIVKFFILNLIGYNFDYGYFFLISISLLGMIMLLDLNVIWKNSMKGSLKFFKRHNFYGLMILLFLIIGNNFHYV